MAKLAADMGEELGADREAVEALQNAKPGLLEDPLVARVSLTIAILAAAGVILGSLESMESNAAADATSSALLQQSRATDAWNAWDARLVREALGRAAPPAEASRLVGMSDDDLVGFARDQEEASRASLQEAERRSGRQERLTLAVMLVQIAIALATISIIARPRRLPWFSAIALGGVGVILGMTAFLM